MIMAGLLSVSVVHAGTGQGSVLDYRIKVRPKGETVWEESHFRVVIAPALITANRVKKPRLGAWRLEAAPGRGVAPAASLLARAARLMYFAGPAPQTTLLASGMTLGSRHCRLWQAQTPPGVAAYVYLAEVAPNLLALSYLSASREEGEVGAMEIHLESVELGPHPSAAEEGTTLLRTLGRWSVQPAPEAGPRRDALDSEAVD
jgi:hypothetical protein